MHRFVVFRLRLRTLSLTNMHMKTSYCQEGFYTNEAVVLVNRVHTLRVSVSGGGGPGTC